MELKETTIFIIIIVAIGLILGIGLFVLGQFQSTVFTNSTATSTSNTILTASTDTLDPIGDGITSSEVKANNWTGLRFDGVDDKVTVINNGDFNSSQNFTWCFEANFSDDETGSFSDFIAMRKSGDDNNRIVGFYINSSDSITFDFRDSTGLDPSSITYPIEYNIKNSYCLDYRFSNATLYINGVFNQTTNISSDFDIRNNNNNFSFGGFGTYMEMEGDNILVFNRSLDYAEVISLGYDRNKLLNYSTTNIIEQNYKKNLLYINSTLMYSTNFTAGLWRSTDGGIDWERVLTLPGDDFTIRGIFRASDGTMYASTSAKGRIYYSIGNDTNWTFSEPIVCDSVATAGTYNGSVWNWAETDDGVVLGGIYGNQDKNCSYIIGTTDKGLSWSIYYNGTDEFGGGSHMHMVDKDPYTGYIYASQGDGIGESRLIRSTDNALTWESLNNDSLMFAQPLKMIVAKDGTRFFGSDSYDPNAVFKTTDDINFEISLRLDESLDGYIWDMDIDNVTGYLYASTVVVYTNGTASIWVSPSNGTAWYRIKQNVKNKTWTGYDYIQADNNIIYYSELTSTGFTDSFYRKESLNTVSESKGILQLNLNENSGTTANDLSSNSNDGTINGPTWATDGVLNTLTAITDYTINTATGLFTIVNTDYSWSELIATYSYSAITDSTGYESMGTFRTGLASFADWIAIIVITIAAAIVLGVILLGFGSGRNRI